MGWTYDFCAIKNLVDEDKGREEPQRFLPEKKTTFTVVEISSILYFEKIRPPPIPIIVIMLTPEAFHS